MKILAIIIINQTFHSPFCRNGESYLCYTWVIPYQSLQWMKIFIIIHIILLDVVSNLKVYHSFYLLFICFYRVLSVIFLSKHGLSQSSGSLDRQISDLMRFWAFDLPMGSAGPLDKIHLRAALRRAAFLTLPVPSRLSVAWARCLVGLPVGVVCAAGRGVWLQRWIVRWLRM